VEVGLNSRIRIGFSERMDRRSVERSLFISPRPPAEPDLRWHGRELEVRMPGDLRPDRTYLVTVGAESADESRNRMVSSYSFAFATGTALNQGTISGQVLPLAPGPSGQVYIWAFDLGEGPDPGPGAGPDPAADPPAYVNQPGEAGGYRFPRLGPGRYRVFAFADVNRDRAYTPGQDPLAVPPADVVLDRHAREVALGPLKMAVRDTIPPRLTSARTPDGSHILLRFDEAVRALAEIPITGPRGPLRVQAVYVTPDDSTSIGLLTGPQVGGADYRVHLAGITDRSGNSIAQGETANVRGDAQPDGRRPTVVSSVPAIGARYVPPDATLRVVFSEPLEPFVTEGFWTPSDSTEAPTGEFSWLAPNAFVFVPSAPWQPGATHRLVARAQRIADPSGNTLDGRIEYRFTVLDPDELGDLTGVLEVADAPVVVEARRLRPPDRTDRYVVSPGDSLYRFPDLIPGPYHVAGFLDADGDGSWTPGSIRPFSPAEPVTEGADTLEVRPRWQTASQRRFTLNPQRLLNPGPQEE
jgi:hypothetical protein